MRLFSIPSLRWRLVAVMVLAYIAVASATLMVTYSQQNSSLRQQLKTSASNNAAILSAGSALPIDNNQVGALDGFMKALTKSPGLYFVAIVRSNTVIATAEAGRLHQRFVVPAGVYAPTAFTLPNGRFEGVAPIFDLSVLDGYAVVILSDAPVQNSLNEFLQRGIAAGVLGLIIFILLSLVISRYILGPLMRLAAAARQLRQGDLGARITQNEEGEMSTVAEAFNSMAASLEQRITHLSFLARSGAILPNILRTGGDVQPVLREFCQLLRTAAVMLVERADLTHAPVCYSEASEDMSWWEGARERAQRATGPTSFETGDYIVMVVPVLGDSIFVTAREGDIRFIPEERQVITNFAYQLSIAANNAELLESQQEALQVKDQFLSIVSHELRTPLTTIKGYAQMLRRKITGDPQAERFADNIDAQVGRLARLVDDLLDVTRFSRQQFELMPQQMDLRPVLEDVTSRFRVVASRHKIDLLLDRGAFEGLWDHDRLEQVLNNLVSNAIKYSPSGGRVVISTRHEDDYVVVAVRDQGQGIPEEDQQHLFERFFRGRAEGQDVKGLGLGLYVTRRIIEAHGGRIWVSSRPGEGSEFSFSLPLQPQQAPAVTTY